MLASCCDGAGASGAGGGVLGAKELGQVVRDSGSPGPVNRGGHSPGDAVREGAPASVESGGAMAGGAVVGIVLSESVELGSEDRSDTCCRSFSATTGGTSESGGSRPGPERATFPVEGSCDDGRRAAGVDSDGPGEGPAKC